MLLDRLERVWYYIYGYDGLNSYDFVIVGKCLARINSVAR